MAYIRQKNTEVVIYDENGPIVDSAQMLSSHPAVLTGFHEVVDAELPNQPFNKLIFSSGE